MTKSKCMKARIIYILFLLFVSTVVMAQEMRVVSGVIKDSNGDPIIGCNVLQKGTTNGTLTDFDGFYEIIVPLGSKLQFTYIGMRTSEMVVTTANSKPAPANVAVPKTVQIATPSSVEVKEETEEETETEVADKSETEKESAEKDKVEKSEDAKNEAKTDVAAKNEPETKKAESENAESEKPAAKQIIKPSREDQSLSPYFQIMSESPEEAEMPLKKTDVAVNIAGVIADVCVKQVYINESRHTLEAIYVFPGSTRAAVYGMAMTIGERRIEAKIKKKEQARQEYEQAKQAGKSTTLLEQHRPNVFQMNVANILPGDTIIVEMRYTELLENTKGTYEFVYPTVVGPRYTETSEDWVARSTAAFKSGKTPEFNIKTIVQAGMPIRKISSSTHSLAIESPTPDQAIVSLSNPKDFEGDRDYILQYELQGGKVESGLLRYEHGDENFFLLMIQPPKKPTSDQIPPREYVFIIDVSGSMYGFPLEISKTLIRKMFNLLRPIDRFNVMLFESSSAMLYKESVAATKENIENAIDVVDKRKGGGGTRLYPALQKAMNFKETQGFSRTFVIATDGFVTVEKEAFNYVRANLNKANLFPFGIGSSVNRYIIEGLAHAGMGTPYIVTNQSQAHAIAERAINEISQPVLTNISVDWGDFDVYDVEPVGIPDVFAERPILIYGKYKGKPKGTITVSGNAGEKVYEETFDVAKARKEHNQALRYLWARNQIRYFDDYAQYYEGTGNNGWGDYYGRHQRSSKQIEYVTNLGLKYNLLTQYTSFLAVDNVVRQAKPQPVAEPVQLQENASPASSSSATPSPAASSPNVSSPSGNQGYKSVTASSSTPQTVSAPDFQLTEDESRLDEVVVVGYGVQTRSHVSGGVGYVSSNDIAGSSSAHVLQGRIPGVEISQTSGEPGDPSSIRIRGAGSMMGNNDPLVVIDGVAMEYSDLTKMNPQDIEGITVLKDASAVAVYGSRGANGVIVVTTKKPAYKAQSVSFTSSISVDTPNRLPKLQREFAQGSAVNGVPTWNTENDSFSWGPNVNTVNAPTYDQYDIFKTGYSLKNFLTLSGRQQGYYYALKLGNNTQRGFIPKSKFSENAIGLKVGFDRNKWSYVVDVNYKNTDGDRLQRGYNMSNIMKGILLSPATFDNRAYTLADGSQRLAGSAVDNPYWTINNNPFSDEADRFTGSINVNYKLAPYLGLQYQLSGDYMSGESETALNLGSVYQATGHIMKREEKFKAVNSKFMAKFDKNWNDFGLSATLGHEYSKSRRSVDRMDGYDLSEAGNYHITNAQRLEPYYQLFNRHSNAVFGRTGLNYRSIIMWEMAMRGEWSSINDKTLLAPSMGLAVNFRELIDNDFFSQLRLFANMSRADKETPLYLDPSYFNSAIYNLNDASNHFESREVILDNLKPETIRNYEVGANVGVWNNRLVLSTSYYWKKGKDQLLPTQVSASAVQLENCGTFKTHGLEASLLVNVIRNRNFNWTTQLIFTRERNKVTDLGGRTLMLAGIEDAVGSYAIEGQPLGVLYGTAYERNAEGQMLIGSDGFPVMSKELSVLGNPNPDWRMSWVNTLEYRNFSLSVLFDYKKGGDMWNGTRNTMNYYGTSRHSAEQRNTTNYIFPGVLADGTANTIPVNCYGDNLNENRWGRYGQYGVGEDGIEDASYIKLREVSLGYRIPLRLFQKRTNLKVSVFANNILLYTKYKGVDPETNLTGSSNGFGLDYFNIPGVQSMGMSLNWEF